MTQATSKFQRPPTVLRIDSSARGTESTTRKLTGDLIDSLRAKHGDLAIVERDVSQTVTPLIDPDWVSANFTDPEARDEAQRAALAHSDTLVAELKAADIIVVGVPIYNFGIPAALKAWVDQIARARETFQYTEAGPEGLLKGKKGYIVAASGGVEIGSDADFATTHMKFVLGFVGITDVTVIAAGQQVADEAAAEKAQSEIAALAA
ncbi:MAG: NAD(P)H-dependent oxidoreductase [Alphaproteobacteria bacterium]|nr:NAD(P)H-dependent oxidoreductase [Alphaproteobacteria bacterium]